MNWSLHSFVSSNDVTLILLDNQIENLYSFTAQAHPRRLAAGSSLTVYNGRRQKVCYSEDPSEIDHHATFQTHPAL